MLERDHESHQALASEMLHRAVIGPEIYTHHEIQAFIQGFKLECPRSGFNLTKVSHIFFLHIITLSDFHHPDQVPYRRRIRITVEHGMDLTYQVIRKHRTPHSLPSTTTPCFWATDCCPCPSWTNLSAAVVCFSQGCWCSMSRSI